MLYLIMKVILILNCQIKIQKTSIFGNSQQHNIVWLSK